MGKAVGITSAMCFGGAGLLALAALWEFAGSAPVAPAWTLLAGAAILIAAGVGCQTILRQQAEALNQRQSRVELLEAQMDQHRSAVDTLADGLDTAIVICDPKATILYANRSAMDMFRFDSPAGRTLLAVTLSYDLEQLVLQAGRTHQPQHAELTFSYPEERVGVAKAWTQEDGGRVFLSLYDITGLRKLERIRRDFVSNVSHELRTPLMIIRSMAETLLEEPNTPGAKEGRYLEKIVSEVDRLAAMSNDLLVLSAAESNVVEKTHCDVAEIFRSVVGQLQEKAAEKNLELAYEGPESLPILANPEQIRQVALNLVENGLNYTNKGRVDVQAELDGSEVEIRVRDTGIGIASDHVDRIFERFYRVDKARARASGGTGLGLSIVKHIVEAHGGRVRVNSALNEGSTFVVRLPVSGPAERPAGGSPSAS